MKTVLLIANSTWNILNFRSGLLDALRAEGHIVRIAAPFDGHERTLRKRGFPCRNLRLDRKGVNPLSEFVLLIRIFVHIKNIKPDIVLGFTIKPNLYGGIACRLLGIYFTPNVTGLGTLFITRTLLTRLVTFLYRFAYRRASRVFFQNNDDLVQFTSLHIVSADRARRIPGSGLNHDRFKPLPMPTHPGFTFLFMGRFLLDKGVAEYAMAAAQVKKGHPQARFLLLGSIDTGNHRSATRQMIDRWVCSGAVELLDRTDDVRPHIAACDCVVLPSYREGLSHTLLEAASMAKPIITTDVTGCRDVVEDGVTGYLCRVRDNADLADKMIKMIFLSPDRRSEMGKLGRFKVEREFDERIVIRAYMELIREVPEKKPTKEETA